MIPILYEKDTTAFINNGLCRLRDCLSCIVTEERNGIYELDFEYPVNGANYEQIQCGRIIGVTHDENGDVQPFEIVNYSRPINGIVKFHAVHISYRQSQMVVRAVSVNSLSQAFQLLSIASPSNPFTYEADFTATGYMAAADGVPRSVRQVLGGVKGSILDTYGGEYEFDGYTVILHENRGQMRDFSIRYGVNLLSYNEDTSYQGTFTSCVAFWKGSDGEVVTATATLGETGYNGNDIRVPLDLSDKFEEKPTATALQNEALSYMQRNQTNIPARTINVDFVRLSEMGEFSAFQDLLKCNLCDTIKVIFPMYNVTGNFKIVKTVWDVLAGTYNAMELGTLSTTLSEALGIGETSSTSGGGSGLDYIIEEGTEGIWTWRKWASGVAECWGTMTQNITSWSQWGTLYEGIASTHTATYPNGLFTSTPDFWANSKGNATVGAFIEIAGQGSATTTPQIYAVRPTTGNLGNFNFSLYAKGMCDTGSLMREVHLSQSGDVLVMS